MVYCNELHCVLHCILHHTHSNINTIQPVNFFSLHLFFPVCLCHLFYLPLFILNQPLVSYSFRLTINHDLERLATVGRNSQLYLGRERSSAGGSATKGNKLGDQPQVLFLRSISLSPEAASLKGSERMLVQAMDELDRATLDPRVSDTASSR